MNNEESFVLSTLKEFVKLWGSGCQASLNLECTNGHVFYNFPAKLGAPTDLHVVPLRIRKLPDINMVSNRKTTPDSIDVIGLV